MSAVPAVDHRALGLRYADEVRPVADKVTIEIVPRREAIVQIDRAVCEPGFEGYRFARVVGVGPDADIAPARVGSLVLVGRFCGDDINGHGADRPGWDAYWVNDPRADARIVRDTEIVACLEGPDADDR